MKNQENHSPGYLTYAIILIVLLALTALSVAVTGIHLGAFTVALALLIACVKVACVMAVFMHLRSENLFLKLAVTGVFVLFALVIIITFFDYQFR